MALGGEEAADRFTARHGRATQVRDRARALALLPEGARQQEMAGLRARAPQGLDPEDLDTIEAAAGQQRAKLEADPVAFLTDDIEREARTLARQSPVPPEALDESRDSAGRIMRRFPAGSVHQGTPEAMKAFVDQSRDFSETVTEIGRRRGFDGKELDEVVDANLAKLPISKFALGELSADHIRQAARFVPAFGQLSSRNLSVSSKILTKVDRTRPKQTDRALQRLPRLTEASTEVLPNPQNPNRILLLRTNVEGEILAVADVAVQKDGVEVVSFFTSIEKSKNLVNRARQLARGVQ